MSDMLISSSRAARRRRCLGLPALLLPTCALTAAEGPVADAADPVVITPPPTIDERIALSRLAPLADGAEAVGDEPGVALGRMGGHGSEPVLRGQQQGRLTVLQSGQLVAGGCPNRMDPPTSYIVPDQYDRVDLQLGPHSLTAPVVAPGGSIAFSADDPEPGWHGRLRGGASGDAGEQLITARSNWATADHQATLFLDHASADNYHDGDGRAVRSAWRQQAAGASAAWRGAQLGLEADVGINQGRDMLFAGAGMDSPETDLVRGSMGLSWTTPDHPWFSSVELRLGSAAVDHLMDNYSLRQRSAPLAMRAETETRTDQAEIDLQLHPSDRAVLLLGLRGLVESNDGHRYASPTEDRVDGLQSLLWPDVERERLGLVAQWDQDLGPVLQLRLGLRYDRVTTEANDRLVDPDPLNPMLDPSSPADLYRFYYGADGSAIDDDLLALLLRGGGTTPIAGLRWHGRIAVIDRAPDATERFLAGWAPMMMAGMRWVGDPSLEVERHHQIEAGLDWQSPATDLATGLTLALDLVDDWVERERAAGQDGILASDGASIYRAVDATLWSLEWRGSWRPLEALAIDASVSWLRGENTTDDQPLAQMPPLGGRLRARWIEPTWSAGLILDWANEQDRVAARSPLENGPTAGWAILGAEVTARPREHLELGVQVANIFDRTYAQHLNRANAVDPTVADVNEPGLEVAASLTWEW